MENWFVGFVFVLVQINAPGRLIRKKILTTEKPLVLLFILAKYNYVSCLNDKTTTDVHM